MTRLRLPCLAALLAVIGLAAAWAGPLSAARPSVDLLVPSIPLSNPHHVQLNHWQQRFQPLDKQPALQPGQEYWLRLHADNTHSETVFRWLDFWPGRPTIQAAFHAQDDGLLVPIPTPGPGQALAVLLPVGNSSLYLQLQVEFEQMLTPQWLSADQASTTLNRRLWLTGAALGALGFLALLTWALTWLYRDRALAALGLWMIGTGLWQLPVWSPDIAPLHLAAAGLPLTGSSLLLLAFVLHKPTHNGPWWWCLSMPLLALPWLLGLPLMPALQLSLGLTATLVCLFWLYGLKAGFSGTPILLPLVFLQTLSLALLASLILATDKVPLSIFLPLPSAVVLCLLVSVGTLTILCLRLRQQLRHQQALQQQQVALDSENLSRGAMLERIQHTLRSPMSGIRGMTDLLRDTALSAEQQAYLDTIQRANESLQALIGEVLDEPSPGAPDKPVPFAPDSLILEALHGCRNLADQRSMELVCQVPDKLPAVLNGDPARLLQLLLSLLARALRRGRDHVRLDLRCIHLGSQADLQFTVSTPAFPLRENDDDHELALAERLAPRIQAELHHHPDGETDRVTLRLRLRIELDTDDRQGDELLSGKRLLIVHEHGMQASNLAQYARHWGIDTEIAGNSSETLGRVRNRVAMDSPFDLVLLNHDLPTISGLDLARRIRQIQEPPPAMLLLSSPHHMHDSNTYRQAGLPPPLPRPLIGHSLRLALQEALQAPKATAENPQHKPAALKVLLAEDNPVTARVIEAMLAKLTLHCDRVSNGIQAIEACQRQRYDLVLMDCDMPVMDGYAATRRLRQLEKEQGRSPLFICALTAHILDEYREKTRQAGMNQHLAKPVELAQLRALLAELPSAKTHRNDRA